MSRLRTRVAAFTPGPPLRSGGAVYAQSLLGALAERVELAVVSPEPVEWDGPTVAPDDFDPGAVDVAMYFLGNNPDHLFAYHSALRWPGVVVCHEVAFRHVLSGFAPADDLADLEEQLGPSPAAQVRDRCNRGVTSPEEMFLLPVVSRPLRRARAAVVHSRFAQFMVEAEVPELPVYVVPSHTGALPEGLAGGRAEPSTFVVGMFGWLGPHKRVEQALQGVARARSQGVDIRLVAVGAEVGLDVSRLLRSLGLEAVTSRVGPVDDDAFFAHMAAVDVVVNLRYPTLGETSATLVQAMGLGKPVITSDHAQFGEERAAIRIPIGEGEVDGIAAALVRLATCEHCYSLVAAASRARAAECTVDRAADAFVEVIERVR